jgi:hypothetical protein
MPHIIAISITAMPTLIAACPAAAGSVAAGLFFIAVSAGLAMYHASLATD